MTELHKKGTYAEAPGVTRAALDIRNRRRQRKPSDSADTQDTPEARSSRLSTWGFSLDSKRNWGCPAEAAPTASAGHPPFQQVLWPVSLDWSHNRCALAD